MIDTDLAYVAGIVDGEGSISFQRNHFKDREHVIYNPRVRITNTDKLLLDWICMVTGLGKVRPMKMYPANKKQGYDWYLNGKVAAKFLTPLLPYLKIKRFQAEIVIAYCGTMLEGNYWGRRKILTEETIQEREKLREQMLQANNRSGLYN